MQSLKAEEKELRCVLAISTTPQQCADSKVSPTHTDAPSKLGKI